MITDKREQFLLNTIEDKNREIENLKTQKYELIKQVREKDAWLVLSVGASAILLTIFIVFAQDNLKKRYEIESLNKAINQSIINLKSESNEW